MTDLAPKRRMSCPGCDQMVDPLRAPAVSVIEGKIVHFCSSNCRERFLKRAPKIESSSDSSPPDKALLPEETISAPSSAPSTSSAPEEEGRSLFEPELFRSRLLWPYFLQLAGLTISALVVLWIPPFLIQRLPAAIAAGVIAGLATWQILRDRKLGIQKIIEATAMHIAALAFIASSFFGAPTRLVAVCALLLPAADTLFRILEFAGRHRASILAALEAGEHSPIASSWKDNSNLAASVRTFAMISGWIRYPTAALVGLLVFEATADTVSAIIAFATALAVYNPRTVRLSTGDAHLRAALLCAARGVRIREADAVQRAAQSATVLFASKTTLFQPTPIVLDWHCAEHASTKTVLDALLSIEAKAHGRLASAIRTYALDNNARAAANVEITQIEGKGLIGETPWGTVMCGCRGLLLDRGCSTGPLESHASVIESSGRRALFVAMDDRAAAVFAIEERFVPGAVEAVRKLRRMGLETAMISTAETASAQGVAERLGIDTVYFETPETKVGEVLRGISDSGGTAVLVGRGPAFEEHLRSADTAISLGSHEETTTQAGFDAAGCSVDIVPLILRIAKRAHQSARINLVLNIGVYLFGVGLAVAATAPTLFPIVGASSSFVAAVCTFNAPFPIVDRWVRAPVARLRRWKVLHRSP